VRSRFTDALALRRWRTLNLQRLAPVLGAWHHRVMRERDSKKLQEMNEMESAIGGESLVAIQPGAAREGYV